MSDAEHRLVVGPSGSGKTTLLREMHARFDGPSAFLTSKKYERTAASDTDSTTPSYPHLRVRRSNADYPEDIARVRQEAKASSKYTQVIVDECQNAPTFLDGDGPLNKGLREDRSGGVRWVLGTQSPGALRTSQNGYEPIQQIPDFFWVGSLLTWHEGFLNAHNLADMIEHLPDEQYDWVRFVPKSSLPPAERIIDEGRTNKRFG